MNPQNIEIITGKLVIPSWLLLILMVLAIAFDFIIGVLKARIRHEARTSEGFRRSIQKIGQYASALIGGFILVNLANLTKDNTYSTIAGIVGNGLIVVIIYIEVTSIFENAFAIDSASLFATYFIKPVLNILTFQIKNNPATRLEKDENPVTPIAAQPDDKLHDSPKSD